MRPGAAQATLRQTHRGMAQTAIEQIRPGAAQAALIRPDKAESDSECLDGGNNVLLYAKSAVTNGYRMLRML